jgi:phage tail-like protein
MSTGTTISDLIKASSTADELILGFRFAVFMFAESGIPNPIDIRFQKVSGISAEVNTTTIEEGGQNLYAHTLPDRVDYRPLVLERGLVTLSPLAMEFDEAMSQFKFTPSSVLVTLLGDDKQPTAAWMFMKAWPVKWSVSDPDVNQKEIAIETLELAYSRMQKMSI